MYFKDFTAIYLSLGIVIGALGAPVETNMLMEARSGSTTASEIDSQKLDGATVHWYESREMESRSPSLGTNSIDPRKLPSLSPYNTPHNVDQTPAVRPTRSVFRVSFEEGTQEAQIGGIVITQHAHSLVETAADHWDLGDIRIYTESYPNVPSNWDRATIQAKEFKFKVLGGRCGETGAGCEGKIHLGGVSELRDIHGDVLPT
ncbi:hypothetical protein C8R41DRAFT_919612 [Lentinula lateritia]|uniref:Uncharacterized protein n=1 Tax=Lentinula lateritia TaxID=40482 RepID=A0ABQ8VGL9_9AGAR|nr:hypothetical protein C8R41DRAFT_919612 [Lentinula lateritia]